MDVDHHAIALGAAHSSRDYDQRVLADEVANAALLLLALVTGMAQQIELEGIGGAHKEQHAAEPLQERTLGRHHQGKSICVCIVEEGRRS